MSFKQEAKGACRSIGSYHLGERRKLFKELQASISRLEPDNLEEFKVLGIPVIDPFECTDVELMQLIADEDLYAKTGGIVTSKKDNQSYFLSLDSAPFDFRVVELDNAPMNYQLLVCIPVKVTSTDRYRSLAVKTIDAIHRYFEAEKALKTECYTKIVERFPITSPSEIENKIKELSGTIPLKEETGDVYIDAWRALGLTANNPTEGAAVKSEGNDTVEVQLLQLLNKIPTSIKNSGDMKLILDTMKGVL